MPGAELREADGEVEGGDWAAGGDQEADYEEGSGARRIRAIGTELHLPKRIAQLPLPLEPSYLTGSRPSTSTTGSGSRAALARAQLDALLDPHTLKALESERQLTRSKLLTKSVR